MSAEAELTFVDTNVLVYAHDLDSGAKRDSAGELLEHLWSTHSGVISTQVLQEFYVAATRKLAKRIRRSSARHVVETYSAWPVHVVEVHDVVAATHLEERYRLSYWDALIAVSARRAGASRIATEDLQHGQLIEGVAVHNPFASTTP